MMDVEAVMEAALQEELVYELEDPKAAASFRFRCNRWRQQRRKEGDFRFDKLFIKIRDSSVIFDYVRLAGKLRRKDGTPLALALPEREDALREEAEALKIKLQGGSHETDE